MRVLGQQDPTDEFCQIVKFRIREAWQRGGVCMAARWSVYVSVLVCVYGSVVV